MRHAGEKTTGLDCDTEAGCRELAERIEAYWRGQGSASAEARAAMKVFNFGNGRNAKHSQGLWGVASNLVDGLPADATGRLRVAMPVRRGRV